VGGERPESLVGPDLAELLRHLWSNPTTSIASARQWSGPAADLALRSAGRVGASWPTSRAGRVSRQG